MRTEIVEYSGVKVAALECEEGLISNAQEAMDCALSVRYQSGCARIALPKEAFCERFFVLSSGLAGEILQKFVNYSFKVAIYGDYSGYTSKPLRDFIYESNRGRDVFFAANLDEAMRMLARA